MIGGTFRMNWVIRSVHRAEGRYHDRGNLIVRHEVRVGEVAAVVKILGGFCNVDHVTGSIFPSDSQ